MDTSDAERQILITGLGATGFAGKLTGGLVSILWPQSGNDVWDSIRGRVEALINQKIAEDNYANVSNSLTGLKNLLDLYHRRLKDSVPSDIRADYDGVQRHFAASLPHFQKSPLLLPLFARFVNLHLAHMRDGWQYGAAWGFDAKRLADERDEASQAVADYTQYATDGVKALLAQYEQSGKRSLWNARNMVARHMTLEVMDHVHYWSWLDPKDSSPRWHPNRIIYSDPAGGDALDDIWIEDAVNAPRLTGFGATGDSSMWAVRVAFGNGAEETRQWRTGSGSPLMSFDFTQLPSPITGVAVNTTDYIPKHGVWDEWIDRSGVTGLSITMEAGGMVMFVARPDGDTFRSDSVRPFVFSYPGHVLATAHCVAGREGTFIFGFRLANSYT